MLLAIKTKRAHLHDLRPASAFVAAAIGAGSLVALCGGASAQESWNPFRDSTASIPGGGGVWNRQFVREWEANPPKGFPTLAKANIEATRRAISQYTDIVKKGGWPTVPDVDSQRGSSGAAVKALRERLLMSGDLKENSGYSTGFDYYVEKAVKRFQASNGLSPTGIVDKRTRAALNVPAKTRLKQLQVNLPRLQALSRQTPKKYVVVNIPAAQIEAIEDNQVVTRHAGVVGKIDRKTPILKSTIHELNFNPVWHLPPTVISKDLIPKGREMQKAGQDVLAKYGIDAYDGSGRKLDSRKINWSSGSANGLTYKQQPGKDNPLGFLKINFHNQYSVYMHDTPRDSVFGRNFRAASSGCVRVSDIEKLATWILVGNGDWPLSRVIKMKETGERSNVRVKRPVTLFFAYVSAWATEDGIVQFRRDLYQKDGVGSIASAY